MRLPAPTPAAAAAAAFGVLHSALSPSFTTAVADTAEAAAASVQTFEPRGITPEDTVIFVIGCVPFVWAGIEFWRRIAVGESFGTGKDSVVIMDSSGNRPKPVKRVLGDDAIIAARLLFGLAFASGALVLYAGVDLLSK